jgi:hypothetical protein
MKEVVFVEGVNGAGKDYFLDNVHKYFPHSTVHYAPKDNHTHAAPYEAAFITYNTIFESIKKDKTSDTAFIYRSPITELVYNKFYTRASNIFLKTQLMNLMIGFMNETRSQVVYLNPDIDTLSNRRPGVPPENFTELKALYDIELVHYIKSDRLKEFNSFDEFISLIDIQIDSLDNEKYVFMDVDDTLVQYATSFRKNFPNGKCNCVGVFSPPEDYLPIKFISGREQTFDCLNSPYGDIFKSSYNYKYAFFKRMLERRQFFIWYDDYFTIQAQLADEFSEYVKFSLETVKINDNTIGRLEGIVRNSGL